MKKLLLFVKALLIIENLAQLYPTSQKYRFKTFLLRIQWQSG